MLQILQMFPRSNVTTQLGFGINQICSPMSCFAQVLPNMQYFATLQICSTSTTLYTYRLHLVLSKFNLTKISCKNSDQTKIVLISSQITEYIQHICSTLSIISNVTANIQILVNCFPFYIILS